jgi:opacity protein-like surface antigen
MSDVGMPSMAALSGLSGASGAGGSGQGQYDRYSGRRNAYSHLAFEAGAGFSAPTEDSSPYITWGGNVTLGAGYRFNPIFTLMTEYQFIDDKLPGQIIAETGATGGHVHIWSLTLDPVIDLVPKGSMDVYVTGGGGFYRKVTSFTDPQDVLYCDYFYCGVVTQNVVVGHFSSNQGGWNVGMGIAHRFSGNMKLFAEARYLNVDSPAVTTQPNGLGTTTVGAGTKIIPVTFGVRW